MLYLNNDFNKVAVTLNENLTGTTTDYYKINLKNSSNVDNLFIVKDLTTCNLRSNVFNIQVSGSTTINSATTLAEIDSGTTITLTKSGYYDYYIYSIEDLSGFTLYNDVINSGLTSELIEQGQVFYDLQEENIDYETKNNTIKYYGEI